MPRVVKVSRPSRAVTFETSELLDELVAELRSPELWTDKSEMVVQISVEGRGYVMVLMRRGDEASASVREADEPPLGWATAGGGDGEERLCIAQDTHVYFPDSMFLDVEEIVEVLRAFVLHGVRSDTVAWQRIHWGELRMEEPWRD